MFKKRSKRTTAVLVLLLLVAPVLMVLGLTTSVSAGSPPLPSDFPEESGCYDSDGGVVYDVKGTTISRGCDPSFEQRFTDWCGNNVLLFEYSCPSSDPCQLITESHYNCASEGKVCQDGRCVQASAKLEGSEDHTVTVSGTTAWPEIQLRLYSLDLKHSFWEPFSPGADGNWALYHARMDDIGFRVCTVDLAVCSEPITPARKFWWDIHLR